MIHQTKAFERLKKEQQSLIDFAVMSSYAVPALSKAIKGYQGKFVNFEKFVKPIYFKEELDVNKLQRASTDFETNLGKYLLLSAFSFFEFYIKDVVNELVDYHGGKDTFVQNLNKRHRQLMTGGSDIVQTSRKKLQEHLRKEKSLKYKKQLAILELQPDYRHPSELLATYGLTYFIDSISGPNFKSALIPDILGLGFGIDLTDTINKHGDLKDKDLKQTFDAARNLRNRIGHGNTNKITLSKTMDFVRFFRYLSVKTEKHLLSHYFILERFE